MVLAEPFVRAHNVGVSAEVISSLLSSLRTAVMCSVVLRDGAGVLENQA